MKIWKYLSSAALLINCCWSALDHGLSLNNIGPSMIWRFIHRFILKKVFSLSLSDAKHNFDELWWLIIGFFLCPQLIWILFAFLLKVHYIAPGGQRFKECREMLMSFLSRILQTQLMFLFENLSCSGIKSQHFNDHVYSSIIVEMKSERYQFLKSYFWNSSSFGQRPNTLFNAVLWLSCILKTEMTRCKI